MPSGLGDLTGKRILVTGATSAGPAPGFGTARALAGRSARPCGYHTAARPVAVAAEQTRTKLEV